MKPSLLASLALMLAVVPAAMAQLPGLGGGEQKSGDELVPVRAMADVDTVHPGERFHIAVVLDIEPGWHIYWLSAGASGLPTSVEVKGPAGYTIGATRYTRPKAFRGEEGVSFGYERQAVLFVPVTAPAELGDGEATFSVSASWLVCKKACMMGAAERTASVRTTSQASEQRGEKPQVIAMHEPRLPRRLEDLSGAELRFDGSTLTVTGPAAGFDRVELFPVEMPGVTYGPARTSVAGDRFTVEVGVEIKAANARGKPMALRGVIALGPRVEDPSYEYHRALDATGHLTAASPERP
jgi:thiol:disulfide interchange protein DsbD